MSLEIKNLTHVYRNGVRALDDVTLEINGTFGLVGPNGAGKTTLMRILATLLRPTAGTARIHGVPLDRVMEIRGMLGYLPQNVDFYPTLSALETVEYFALLSHLTPRRDKLLQVLEQVGLAEAADRRVGGFSGGMKRRLGLAVALVHDPRVVIVDEPTSGLDPEGRLEVRRALGALGGDRTVLLSTHILPDVETTCSRMAVLHKGKIRFTGSPAELAARAKGRLLKVRLPREAIEKIERERAVVSIRYDGEQAVARVFWEGGEPPWPHAPAEPSLEDGYFYLLHREERIPAERS
ncbi:ABC transporter ATP-binding protein [Oceanithermus desulfurans]|uniref:Multidrug ABC transporter ATP-binding protein n=2 Tax=Oceanithermus desulfurans TaxID=227924 RepID=A0A511RMF7_9DEIN|nr:ATP-binding cassette domain-containing protein [Oceanithermus desulfurans]MBB6029358.1 ABC-type multidrug transport system ATPase subunit [Oceanithermus desulfurans]GEM89986.1 multidrug ABC transporter ATP-binding protein [Oceanithermus desulfurans NBRC 100063]